MVRVSRKEAIFDGLSTKEDIVDAFHVDDEENIEEEVSEATFRNGRKRPTHDSSFQ